MRKILLIIFLAAAVSVQSQDNTISLKDCFKAAYENYPNAKQRDYYKSINELKLENLGINYLPQISFKGQASYQSDVTKLNISLPAIKPPEMNKDQYKVTMDVKQLLYDGGNISSLKETENRQVLVDNQKIEVELFSLKPKINDLYFSVLLYQEKKNVNETLKKDLLSRISEMESRIRNEVSTASNLYILQAQLIQTEEDIQSIEIDRISALKMLGELIGVAIPENTKLEIPAGTNIIFDNDFSGRPEYKLFSFQKDQLNAYSNSISTRVIPKLSAFGQAGYGRPGLNMLDNTFQPYYMVGLTVSWNPINWSSDNNEKQIYSVNSKIVDSQKETFDKNLKVSLEKYKSDILKYSELKKKDEELIALRDKIVSSVFSQLQNGTVTSTIYLTELNNKTQAEIMLATHKIQLLQAQINYLTAKGVY
ncbi:MAG: TolC family protein [Ignavibacteria bacterium]|nr:TolC family protein [Ignavibacteria bacterium]